MIFIKKWLDYYGQIFTLENNQVQFLDKLCKQFPAPAKFLSVECGPAAASLELAEKGNNVTVTDSFSEFTDSVNETQKNKEKKVNICNFNPLDVVRYLRKEPFNVIYCANYRLIFIKDKISIQKLMLDSKMMLTDGGYLVLDLINFSKYDFSSSRIDIAAKKSENVDLYSYILKDAASMKYILNQQVVTKGGKSIPVVKDEEITPISLETFKAFANQVQFSSVEFYSDYMGNPLTKDSEKIICVLKK